MALAAATVWEVRTTASDVNGGGFVAGATGTDFSQQDAAQFALTSVTTAGTGATFLTATAAASMVGNILNVVSGTNFVVGRFQILSVSVGVSVTVDRNICTGAGASGVINIGGALATIGVAAGVYVASNKIFVKTSGGYTHTATTTFAVGVGAAPTTIIPFTRVIGYTTTRGDLGRPTITLSTNTGLTALSASGVGISFENFIINCASLGTSTGVKLLDTNCRARNIKVSNFTLDGIFGSGNFYSEISDCEVTGGTSAANAGIEVYSSVQSMLRNYIHDNACSGILCSFGITMAWNLIVNNTGASSDGVRYEWMVEMFNNTIHGSGRHGISGITQYGPNHIRNNIFSSNGGYGMQVANAAGWCADPDHDGNAYYNNTSGTRNFSDDTTVNKQNNVSPYTNVLDEILSGSPFTNAAGGDFTLNNTAGAGALCRATGSPGGLPGISQLGYIDMGALQHQDSPSIISVSSINPVIVNRFGVAGY